MDKLNSILLYLDHQLGTVSLTPEEVASLGGVKNTEEPSHTIVEGKKEKQKKEPKNKEKNEEKKEEKAETEKKEEKQETEKKEEKKEEKPETEKKEEKGKKKEKKEKKKKEEKKEEKKDEKNEEKTDEKEEKKEEKKPKARNKAMDPNEVFKLCDFRVGYVEECKILEGFEDIYSLLVELGEEKKRIIGTGLRKFVPLEKIHHSKLIVFSNLKPKRFGKDFESNGMILCAGLKDGDKELGFEIVRPDPNAKPGEKVYIDGTVLDPSRVERITQKRFNQAIAHLKTDDDCFATYNGVKLRTESGYVTAAPYKNAPIT